MTILENQLVVTGFLGMVIKVLHPALERFGIATRCETSASTCSSSPAPSNSAGMSKISAEASIDRDDPRLWIDNQDPVG